MEIMIMTTENTSNTEYLFTLTSFDGDADRVAAPLVLANTALATGGNVILWLSLEGVELARAGSADKLAPRSFPPVSELLDTFIENGGRIGVCPPCAKTYELDEASLVENAEWMGAAVVVEAAAQRKTMSF
jgi:uncharacterized protein